MEVDGFVAGSALSTGCRDPLGHVRAYEGEGSIKRVSYGDKSFSVRHAVLLITASLESKPLARPAWIECPPRD